MNLYTSMTIRYLKINRKRTIVTIIGVILSTALICGVGNIYASFMDYNLRETIRKEGSFYSTFYNVEKENIHYITESSGVTNYGMSKNLGYASIGNQKLLQVKQYDKESFKNFQINIKEGRMPKNKNEIVVSEDGFEILKQQNYKLNDEITLNIGDRSLSTGEKTEYSLVVMDGEKIKNPAQSTYKIVGIIDKPVFENGNFVTTAISYLDISAIKKNQSVNVSIIVNEPKKVYSLSKTIAKNANLELKTDEHGQKFYDIKYNENLLMLKGASQYKNISTTLTVIVGIISGLVVVCTIATVYNSFSISVSDRRKQFGILNSIGATNKQIRNIVFIEGIIISLISLPIGSISGLYSIKLVFLIIKLFFSESSLAQKNLRVVYNPNIMTLSILLVLISIFMSVFITSVIASKISPLESIRNNNDYKIKEVKSSRLVKKLFKIEGDLAYKNLRRNKKRFRVSLISLTISIVIFISFNGFMSLLLKAESIRNGQINYDIGIYSKHKEIGDNIISNIENISGIRNLNINYEGNSSSVYLDIKKESLTKDAINTLSGFYQPDEKSNKTYTLLSNYLKFPGDMAIKNLNLKLGKFDKNEAIKNNGVVLLNKGYYEEPGKKGVIDITKYSVGDEIKVYTKIEDKNGLEKVDKVYNLKIMAITDDLLPGEANYGYGGISIITYDEVGKKLGINLHKDKIYIDTDKDELTRNSIKEIAKNHNLIIRDILEEQQSLEQNYMAMQVFVYGFIAVITLVSIINIMNTIGNSIYFRKKELSVIRSIGITPKGLSKMIYLESFLYGALSLSYGIPISILIIMSINKVMKGVIDFGMVLPWTAIGICILGIFLVTFISSYMPMRKINKENIIENIRQESI